DPPVRYRSRHPKNQNRPRNPRTAPRHHHRQSPARLPRQRAHPSRRPRPEGSRQAQKTARLSFSPLRQSGSLRHLRHRRGFSSPVWHQQHQHRHPAARRPLLNMNTLAANPYDLHLKRFLWYSVALHSALILAMVLAAIFHWHGNEWSGVGGDQGGVAVKLVSNAGIPMPRPNLPADSQVVDNTDTLN